MCKRCDEKYGNGRWRKAEVIEGVEFGLGSKPQCAFKRGKFTADNWNCVTMNLLREIADELVTYNGDERAALIPVGGYGDELTGHDPCNFIFYVYLQWYKRRGQTERAVKFSICEDVPPEPLTLKDAERVIKEYELRKKTDTTER